MVTTHIVLYALDIFALLFLLGLLRGYNLLGNQRKSPFSYGVIFIIISILAEAGTILPWGGWGELRSINIIFNIIGFAITPIIPIVLIAIFDIKIIRLHRLFLIPTILNIFLVALSPFFGLIFSVDANNHYERGSIFFFFVLVYVTNIIMLAVTIWYTGQKYLYPIKFKIALLAFFTVSATSVQLVVPLTYTSWHCVTLSLLLLYILLSDFDSSFDTVTKLYNRAAFEKEAKRLSGKEVFSIIVMDINNFKEVNDKYGHEYGDIALKELGEIIRNSFHKSCSGYRIGGDEFCVICRDGNEEKIEQHLKAMTNMLTSKRQNDNWLPTVAYGYSVYRRGEALSFDEVMKKADEHMYLYKNSKEESNTW